MCIVHRGKLLSCYVLTVNNVANNLIVVSEKKKKSIYEMKSPVVPHKTVMYCSDYRGPDIPVTTKRTNWDGRSEQSP